MATLANVHLSLPSSAENVLVVRQALSAVAAGLALDAIETNDLNTAVSEACNNVVMHAYGGGEGSLEVEVFALAGALAVVVRDRGCGMGPRALGDADDSGDGQAGEHEDRHAGMGIPVMEALARRVEFSERVGGGTEVRMEFAAPNAPPLAQPPASPGLSGAAASSRTGEPLEGEPSSAIELRLAPNEVTRAVLPRVLSALAARAHFSIDQIAHVRLLADALAAGSGETADPCRLDVDVTVAPRCLGLRIASSANGDGEAFELSLVDDGAAPR